MTEKVLIYGKDTWPYTTAAREAYAKKDCEVDYFDVTSDSGKLAGMLKHSDGKRKVPVIVDQGKVSIGFEGGSWGVWFFGWRPKKRLKVQGSRFRVPAFALRATARQAMFRVGKTGYWALAGS